MSYLTEYNLIADALIENAPDGITIEKLNTDGHIDRAIAPDFKLDSFTFNAIDRDNPPQSLVITKQQWADIQKYGDIAGAIIKILRG